MTNAEVFAHICGSKNLCYIDNYPVYEGVKTHYLAVCYLKEVSLQNEQKVLPSPKMLYELCDKDDFAISHICSTHVYVVPKLYEENQRKELISKMNGRFGFAKLKIDCLREDEISLYKDVAVVSYFNGRHSNREQF